MCNWGSSRVACIDSLHVDEDKSAMYYYNHHSISNLSTVSKMMHPKDQDALPRDRLSSASL